MGVKKAVILFFYPIAKLSPALCSAREETLLPPTSLDSWC